MSVFPPVPVKPVVWLLPRVHPAMLLPAALLAAVMLPLVAALAAAVVAAWIVAGATYPLLSLSFRALTVVVAYRPAEVTR